MEPTVGSLVGALVLSGLLFVILERWAPARKQPSLRRPGLSTDLVYWFFTPLVTKTISRAAMVLILVAVALASGVEIERSQIEKFLAPSGPVAELPWPVQLAGLLLLSDGIAYFTHRWFHGPRLWRFHAVHHSSTAVDWLSSVRVHPVNDAVVRIAQAVPLVLLGFDATLLVAYVPLLAFFSIFVHANIPWSLGPFRYVIATPAFHRWHHAAEDRGLNRNFAGMFPVFDLIFGTFYMPGREPETYGVPSGDVPAGIAAQLAYPFRRQRS